jgi:drug/metabolite transporter (DMT)-like permease
MNLSPETFGQLAALSTALCWGFNAMLFTDAGKRVGSDTVTHVRLWLALIMLCLLHFILFGTLFPWNAEPHRFLWLGLSGAVGFVMGDLFLFEAFVLIGTSRALVVKTFAPALAVLLGYLFLNESLAPLQLMAIGITLSGILLVVVSRNSNTGSPFSEKKVLLKGVFYAALGAVGQAVGVIFSKQGLDNNFSPISATLIRVSIATICMFAVAWGQGRVRHHVASLRDGRGMFGIASGTLLGPVIGVSLSLYALQKTSVGVASTLMEMAPIVVLVVSSLFFGQRPGWREWAGTFLAVAGAAALFL